MICKKIVYKGTCGVKTDEIPILWGLCIPCAGNLPRNQEQIFCCHKETDSAPAESSLSTNKYFTDVHLCAPCQANTFPFLPDGESDAQKWMFPLIAKAREPGISY